MNIDDVKRYVLRNSKYSNRFGKEIYFIKMPLDNPMADTYSARIRKHYDGSNTKMYRYNTFMYSFQYVCKRIFNDYKKSIIKFSKERA